MGIPINSYKQPEELLTTTLNPVIHMSGSIVQETEIIYDFIAIGDNEKNMPIDGILTFDISELAGETIHNARLNITTIWNTPGDVSEMGLLSIQYNSF